MVMQIRDSIYDDDSFVIEEGDDNINIDKERYLKIKLMAQKRDFE